MGEESDWVKSLLLFFDRVAILLPDYMYGRHWMADQTLVAPLEERELLQILEPKKWIDRDTAYQLAEIIVELLTSGAFDDLPDERYFHELSQSRIGYGADVELADFLVENLREKGLARPSKDGVSIPLHPTVRTTILVILGQLSRSIGTKYSLNVHPTTNRQEAVSDLVRMLSRERMPSRDSVITLDLEPVSLNLNSMPLDDVLQFRAERQGAHRSYMRNLQRFMAELASIDNAEEREKLLLERRQEIADEAHAIRAVTTRAFRKNLSSWSMGIAGAAWSLGTGDPIGLALTACSLIPGMFRLPCFGEKQGVTAYSYVFDVQRQLGS